MFKPRKSANFIAKWLSSLSSLVFVLKIAVVVACLSFILSEQQTKGSADAFVLQELPLYKIALIAHANKQHSKNEKNTPPKQMRRHRSHRKTPKIRNSKTIKKLEINSQKSVRKTVKESKSINKNQWQFPIIQMSPSEIDAKTMDKLAYYADNYYKMLTAPNIEKGKNKQ